MQEEREKRQGETGARCKRKGKRGKGKSGTRYKVQEERAKEQANPIPLPNPLVELLAI
jgi:hypothetical protein